MKRNLVIFATLLVVGCSSTKNADQPKVDPPRMVQSNSDQQFLESIANQRLSTTFKRQGIKFEWDCKFYQSQNSCQTGDIIAIEVTGYASANGNSENLRELAFRVAEVNAKAKLRHFIHEEIYSSRVINTMSKNIERANDRLKSKVDGEQVSISDEEAQKDGGVNIRENSNNISRTVVEIVRANAAGILRGVYVKDEMIFDKQTVGVTIRWDRGANVLSKSLNNIFGN